MDLYRLTGAVVTETTTARTEGLNPGSADTAREVTLAEPDGSLAVGLFWAGRRNRSNAWTAVLRLVGHMEMPGRSRAGPL